MKSTHVLSILFLAFILLAALCIKLETKLQTFLTVNDLLDAQIDTNDRRSLEKEHAAKSEIVLECLDETINNGLYIHTVLR